MSAVRRCTWPIRTPGSRGRGARSNGSIEPWTWAEEEVMWGSLAGRGGSGGSHDEHRGARRVAGQQAVGALLHRSTDRRQSGAHRGELLGPVDLERPMAQPDGVGGRRAHALALPGVEADVVVVAAGRDEHGRGQLGHDVEAEALAVEARRGLEVADVQVDVAHPELAVGVAPELLVLHRLEQGA